MKRLPLLVSFVLFIVLCASIAYWAMQLFKPPVRPVAAPPRAAKQEVRPEAAAALLGGGRSKVAVASNYQLRGVVMSGNSRESVAILSADGKPAQAVRMAMEVMPGVTIKEVHRDYVLLSEGGVTKRVELPESSKEQVDIATVSPVRTAPARPTAPGTPPTTASPQHPAMTRPPPVVAPPPPPAVVNPSPQTGQPAMPQMGQPGMGGGMPQMGVSPGGMVNPNIPPSSAGVGANPPASPEPPPPAAVIPGAPPMIENSSGK
jgi:general secretion pathway protein C